MDALIIGLAIVAAPIISRPLDNFFYRVQRRQEDIDEVVKNRYEFVKHAHLAHFDRKIEDLERRVFPERFTSDPKSGQNPVAAG